jgi:hypothetical protein
MIWFLGEEKQEAKNHSGHLIASFDGIGASCTRIMGF